MGHYLDGEDGKVFVQMYKGSAVGMSFPTDGNKHYDPWITRFDAFGVKVLTYEDGSLISIEVKLSEDVVDLETSVS